MLVVVSRCCQVLSEGLWVTTIVDSTYMTYSLLDMLNPASDKLHATAKGDAHPRSCTHVKTRQWPLCIRKFTKPHLIQTLFRYKGRKERVVMQLEYM